SPRTLFARRAGRAMIWTVFGLLAFTGLRTLVFPTEHQAAPAQPNAEAQARKDAVPEAEAQQVAARFARSYLTWDSSNPDGRAKELVGDLAKGIDPKLGWDGTGYQAVAQTIPGAVTQVGHQRARVSVDVRVSVVTAVGGKQQTISTWRALEVPVARASGRVVVTGQPALVGMPDAVTYQAADDAENDTALASATRDTVTSFLQAWAEGSQDQAAAPGADIPSFAGDVAFTALDSWTVDVGSGDERTGTAAVRWKVGGAHLQQTYRITLTKVAAGSASRWQVSAVTAKTP
ncbi:conjugal transfer protein, partial [Streptomyces sp. NPDC002586]